MSIQESSACVYKCYTPMYTHKDVNGVLANMSAFTQHRRLIQRHVSEMLIHNYCLFPPINKCLDKSNNHNLNGRNNHMGVWVNGTLNLCRIDALWGLINDRFMTQYTVIIVKLAVGCPLTTMGRRHSLCHISTNYNLNAFADFAIIYLKRTVLAISKDHTLLWKKQCAKISRVQPGIRTRVPRCVYLKLLPLGYQVPVVEDTLRFEYTQVDSRQLDRTWWHDRERSSCLLCSARRLSTVVESVDNNPILMSYTDFVYCCVSRLACGRVLPAVLLPPAPQLRGVNQSQNRFSLEHYCELPQHSCRAFLNAKELFGAIQ
ncbi:hypothetical protein J6590_019144 [Homalodisca vitripennis]|nr:hypothetical protein J6590_019144 [Homalodisca vitripennis]